jgi:hypothetical protein
MAEKDISSALAGLRADDLRLDDEGRVVIMAPSVNEKLKNAGLKDGAAELARSDTNIICCGNSKCGKAADLGSLVERFAGGNPGLG